MIPIFLAAVFAAATLASPAVQSKHGVKPCDAQTGCLHPAFK
jgi:hypothetical protein